MGHCHGGSTVEQVPDPDGPRSLMPSGVMKVPNMLQVSSTNT